MSEEMWFLKGRYRILHLTWFAFFLSFAVVMATMALHDLPVLIPPLAIDSG